MFDHDLYQKCISLYNKKVGIMRPVYFRKDGPIIRKIMADMAYLVTHKVVRFPKWLYEDGLYFLYKDKITGSIEKFTIDKSNTKKEDGNFYYFPFPFKEGDIEDISI